MWQTRQLCADCWEKEENEAKDQQDGNPQNEHPSITLQNKLQENAFLQSSETKRVTGFYPKLKSFWSCSHMNCCQCYMLHINLHVLFIYFIKLNFNLNEFQESTNTFKSYQD